jgi:hypothetical protein
MNLRSANERKSKRQRTAALQDAVATDRAPLLPQGFGVRLSSAAFAASIRSKGSLPFCPGVEILLKLAATPLRFNVSTFLTF